MSLSPAEVHKIARLARLAITDEQAAAYGPQLSAILSHMDKLRSLDLTGVEPLTHIGDTVNRLDADIPGQTLPSQALLDMAPEAMPPFVKVPKVLGDGGGA
jgi:aspartyl-tRNA(Asn)/glutamyl-tRNA(Gln) amidotransferase subunit C